MPATGVSGDAEMAPAVLANRRLAARAGLALVLANMRYWTHVAPAVRRELKRWHLRAQEIGDPQLRALALSKLDSESFHAEAAAMLATFAPRAHRSSVAAAIVALELLFDYLDGLSERPSDDPLGHGERLFGALVDAVAVVPTGTREPLEKPGLDDDGYLEGLSRAVAVALARLPAASVITEIAQQIAARSGQAQTRMHAVPALGTAQLEEWGHSGSRGTGLGWREFVAGSASSVLVLHALIAAAADNRTTPEAATQIAQAYLPACVVLTLLDGLVDREQDQRDDRPGQRGYLGLFADRDALPELLGQAARRAATQARGLPNGAHHVMILTGAMAYYSSSPGGESELARPVLARLKRELAPLMSPTLAVMRVWRGTRRRAGSSRTKGGAESHHETPETGTVGTPRCCG
ncbi:MAG TPA: DUF2600 family protein [Solirubrobacteraceae bacterium]